MIFVLRGYLIALLLTLPVTPLAFAQDPSPEQCTCDLDGFDEPTGADVVNAASCVLELRHPWCDIYLAATEDSSAHYAILTELDGAFSSDDADALARLLVDMLDGYLKAVEHRVVQFADMYAADRTFIADKIQESHELLAYCTKYFFVSEPISESDDGVRCAVGSQSRWLKIVFERDSRLYLFLFAPGR